MLDTVDPATLRGECEFYWKNGERLPEMVQAVRAAATEIERLRAALDRAMALGNRKPDEANRRGGGDAEQDEHR